MGEIDLRSDTVTKPTPAMREAMYRAEVGDDVFGEDPTVNRLEEMAAERMGKEAALFVASGTMGNLVSLLVHCRRGDEVIVGDLAHSFLYEVGGASALGGLMIHTLPNRRGMLDPAEVEGAIRSEDVHHPRTRLICLENTHNRCGGMALTSAQMHSVAEVAQRYGLVLHLDGARVFNAAIAQGLEVKELTREVDSVMFCLSKGLAAPVGSLVAGNGDFIREARRMRKMVGGGMRQVGILAAAGIVALETMVERLAEDHANARILAEGVGELPGLEIDLSTVETNIVIFQVAKDDLTPQELVVKLASRGVKMIPFGKGSIRAVTHYGVTSQDVEEALMVLQETVAE